jgi:5-methylcytosine-specific restriction endonuclease McrA
MGYQSLVPIYRALCSDEGLCNSCGHKFDNERDIQIEHRSPPRGPKDYGRLHARNIGFYCASCNNGKKDMPYDEWLDKEEETRLSNEAWYKNEPPIQASIFDLLDEPEE